MSTPNMALVLPTDHGSDDVWDTLLDAVFTLIDAHDHTTGKGVKIPANALNVNADVSWSASGVYFAITDLKAIDFQPRPASGMTTYAGALFVSSADNELYWRTTSGTNVKVTSGAALNVAAFTGGIGGDYAAVNALFSFDDATDRYLAQQQGSPRPWAGIALGNLDIYEQAASIVNRVRLKSPASLAASYDVTWLAALPGSTTLLQVSSAGVMTATNSLASGANLTLSGAGHVVRGNEIRTVILYPSLATCSAGTVSATGGVPGGVVNASTTAYIPLGHISELERLKTVAIWKNAAGANATVSVVKATDSTGAFAAITGASGTMIAADTGYLTLTPTTPAVLTDGESYWLKVVTIGGGTVTFVSVEITTDVV